jgi:signal transduction histidine kinase
MLDDLGLVSALNSYLRDLSKRTSLKVQITASDGVEAMDNDKLTMLYRVAQEALTNIEKHAEASVVNLVIHRSRGRVSMEIIDNGKAFDVVRFSDANLTHRLGLTSMRERVEMFGGRFSIVSIPGTGTTVRAEVSVSKKKTRK